MGLTRVDGSLALHLALMIAAIWCGWAGGGATSAEAATGQREPAEILADPAQDAQAQRQALESFQATEEPSDEAVSTLIELITDSTHEADRRRRALSALQAVKGIAPDRLRRLFSLLTEQSEPLELRRAILATWREQPELLEKMIPEILAVLENPHIELSLRRMAAEILSEADSPPSEVSEAFIDLLNDATEEVSLRREALVFLIRHQITSEKGLGALLDILTRSEETVAFRKAALDTVRHLDVITDGVVATCVTLIQDEETPIELRTEAVSYLREVDPALEEGQIQALLALALNPSQPAAIRSPLVSLLRGVGEAARPYRDQLAEALERENHPTGIRLLAARTLGRLAPDIEDQLPALLNVLRNREEPDELRHAAAEAAQPLSQQLRPHLPMLLKILEDIGEPDPLKRAILRALGPMAQGMLTSPETLDRQTLKDRIETLQEMQAAITKSGITGEAGQRSSQEIGRVLNLLQAEKESRWWYALLEWAEANQLLTSPWIRAGGGILVLLLLMALIWKGMTWLAPLKLAQLNEALRPIALPLPNGRRFGLPQLSLISLWEQHPKVVEAWADRYLPAARETIEAIRRRSNVTPYIASPVLIDEQPLEKPSLDDWRRRFNADLVYLVVHGDRGTGKTALAYRLALAGLARDPEGRLAQRPLFPIILTPEDEAALQGGGDDLIERMRTGFSELVGESGSIPRERFLSLVRQARLLVIADGFSGWPGPSRSFFLEAVKEAAIPRTLVTTRTPHDAEKNRTGAVEVRRLDGDAASRFLKDYLAAQGKDGDFPGTELMDSARNLAEMTGGRTIPADIVQMYADFLWMEKEQRRLSRRPQSLTEVMLHYLTLLQAGDSARAHADAEVRSFACRLAWACVREGFCAAPITLDRLRDHFSDDPEWSEKLNALIDCGALQAIGRAQESVTFVRAPLAEYLAAYEVVLRCGEDEEAWRHLLEEADRHDRRASLDFLQAIEDCGFNGRALLEEMTLPGFVREELDQRIGINDAQKEARLQKRVYSLVQKLLNHDADERNEMIEELRQIGPKGQSAVPHLLETFRNRREDLEVRQSAIQALAALGAATPSTLSSLLEVIRDKEEHLFFRIETLEVLARISPGEDQVVSVLVELLEDEQGLPFFRSKVAHALAMLGEQAQAAVPALDRIIRKASSPDVQAAAKRARQQIQAS